MRTYKKWHNIGGEIMLLVCVTDDIPGERSKESQLFGPPPEEDYYAIASYEELSDGSRGNHFAIWLPFASLYSLIGHEIWHATTRILEKLGIKPEASSEFCAQLQGQVTNLTFLGLTEAQNEQTN